MPFVLSYSRPTGQLYSPNQFAQTQRYRRSASPYGDLLLEKMSVSVDIFYLPNSGYFDKTGVFQQPQAITRFEGFECNRDVTPTVALKRLQVHGFH
jgi:hypothetical protein